MSHRSDDEIEFLSLIEEAEARAAATLNLKRQKLSPASTARSRVGREPTEAEEGSYTSALRGSHSSAWKQQQELRSIQAKTNIWGYGPNSRASDGGCFKCGMTGHFARDCPARGERDSGGGRGFVGDSGDVPIKACPCGLGNCVALTSSTVKNPGRKFYRCPANAENGGCGFFEWCDSPARTPPARNTAYNQASNPAADFPCPCGAGSCAAQVSKSGSNPGRLYYRCPAEGNASCGFFKWCTGEASTASLPNFTPKYQEKYSYPSNQRSTERKKFTCFTCGQEGHFSPHCPTLSSDDYVSTPSVGVTSSASKTCFKCGKSGHWVQQCLSS